MQAASYRAPLLLAAGLASAVPEPQCGGHRGDPIPRTGPETVVRRWGGGVFRVFRVLRFRALSCRSQAMVELQGPAERR